VASVDDKGLLGFLGLFRDVVTIPNRGS